MTMLLRAIARQPIRSFLATYTMATAGYGAFKEYRAIMIAESITNHSQQASWLNACTGDEEVLRVLSILMLTGHYRRIPAAHLPLLWSEKVEFIAIGAGENVVTTTADIAARILSACDRLL